MDQVTCGNCGTVNPASRVFCRGCRELLEVTAAGGASGVAPTATPRPGPGAAEPGGAPAVGGDLPTPTEHQGAAAPGLDPVDRSAGQSVVIDVGPNPQVCPVCGTLNEADRYYCRLGGHELRAYHEPAEDEHAEQSWWRRLKDRVTGRVSKDQLRAGRRQLRGMSRYTRNFRIAMAGGAVGLLVVAIAPGPRRYVTRALKDVGLPDRHVFVDVADAAPIDGQWSSRQWDPAYIADNRTTTAWASVWPGGGGEGFRGDGSCREGSDVEPGIVVTFEHASDLDRLRVWAGTWVDDPARGLRVRPQFLQVRGIGVADPRCDYVELDDTPDEQRHDLRWQDDVAGVEIRIISVYGEPDADPDNDLVAISELWFERQR